VTARFETVDEYIGSFPEDVRNILQDVRRTIRTAIPTVGETISYQMPTFTLAGKPLVYLAGWKRHVSVYPAPTGDAAFQRDLAPYRAATGTVQFPLGKPIPLGLVERLVSLLVEERAGV
jgi:uncharacterized protein YdhG (YjbR/CyaY superfamily)